MLWQGLHHSYICYHYRCYGYYRGHEGASESNFVVLSVIMMVFHDFFKSVGLLEQLNIVLRFKLSSVPVLIFRSVHSGSPHLRRVKLRSFVKIFMEFGDNIGPFLITSRNISVFVSI
uniref:Uncharacterized protein n=1 Tax=Euplotes crassus TaxID=5936 RepID=A0A7S3NSA3_EUPCR